ncbi:MAG: response regulator, partial [Chloroflexota bacterium]
MVQPRVRILVVDDEAVVRIGLRSIFDRIEGFFVVGEAGTAAEAMAAVRRWQPDVVVMDARLSDGSGIEVCREIRAEHPDTRVVMLSSSPDQDGLVASIMAGASGYLLKQCEPERLVEAVETVTRNESLLDPASAHTILDWVQRQMSTETLDPLAALTEQERRILPLIAAGQTNREIGAELFLSDQTVKGYVSSILRKLRLRRRAEAAAFIARHQLHPGRATAAVPGPTVGLRAGTAAVRA